MVLKFQSKQRSLNSELFYVKFTHKPPRHYFVCTYFDGTVGMGDVMLVWGEYGGGDVMV